MHVSVKNKIKPKKTFKFIFNTAGSWLTYMHIQANMGAPQEFISKKKRQNTPQGTNIFCNNSEYHKV